MRGRSTKKSAHLLTSAPYLAPFPRGARRCPRAVPAAQRQTPWPSAPRLSHVFATLLPRKARTRRRRPPPSTKHISRQRLAARPRREAFAAAAHAPMPRRPCHWALHAAVPAPYTCSRQRRPAGVPPCRAAAKAGEMSAFCQYGVRQVHDASRATRH
ncbi:MAG: hypothetical protein J3K34DRAFT_215479 [Monoraphidium minutum]|nr:MAG: hypothetical protein J3K34DRAFT_215479 [Monoraphidium minutum]